MKTDETCSSGFRSCQHQPPKSLSLQQNAGLPHQTSFREASGRTSVLTMPQHAAQLHSPGVMDNPEFQIPPVCLSFRAPPALVASHGQGLL